MDMLGNNTLVNTFVCGVKKSYLGGELQASNLDIHDT